jgi:hypothetical protein
MYSNYCNSFMHSNVDDAVFHSVPNHVEEFISYDEASIEKLYSLIRVEEGQLLLLNEELNKHQRLAKNLIIYLKKVYKLQ